MTQRQPDKVIRTMRYPVRADTTVHTALVAAAHVQRETYNRTVASQLAHRGWVDPARKTPKTPDAVLGQLTDWRRDGEVHGPLDLQRPAALAARLACRFAWEHEAEQARRVVDDLAAAEKWNAKNPEWDWGWWDELGADGRKQWTAEAKTQGRKAPPQACDRFRDQRHPPDDHKRFRRAKDGMKSIALLVPPRRVDAQTLKVSGIGIPIRVKSPKGLPPEERMRSVRLVPRGEHRDMRQPEKLRFEAHVSVEVDVVEPKARLDKVIGLDRGIIDTCALSTGERWSPPEPSAKEAKRLAKTRAAVDALARAGKQGTRAWREALRARRKMYGIIRRREHEAMREYVRSLAERYHTVVVEDLRLPAMTASARGRGLGVAAKTGLNRGLQDARLGTMLRLLVTAVENRGGRVLALPAAYSSQTCAQCGHVDAKSRKGKAFHCTCCGHVDDADVNAGHIMAGRGRVYLGTLAQGYTDQEALNLLWACIKGARDTSSVEPSADRKGDEDTESRNGSPQAHASAEDGYAARGTCPEAAATMRSATPGGHSPARRHDSERRAAEVST